MVTDLPLKKIRDLIEQNYDVALSSLNKWGEFEELRKQANAFKHREGWKHNREVNWWNKEVFRNTNEVKYKAGIETAEKMIDDMHELLRDLQGLVRKNKPKLSHDMQED
jgi:hypothetical protein